jgi:hypothetical protein
MIGNIMNLLKLIFLAVFMIISPNTTFAQNYYNCEGSFFGSKSPKNIFPDTMKLTKPIKCLIKRSNHCYSARTFLNAKGEQKILSYFEFYKKNKNVIVKFNGKQRHYTCK